MKGARIGKPALKAMPTWAILKRAAKRFPEDELSDRAAALTYFAVLALFPALIVMVALLGLLGEYPRTSNALLEIVGKISPGSAVDTFRGPITGVVRAKGGAGALFGLGLAVAIWSASGYIGGFMRAANAIYDVREGRPFWKLRPLQVAITLAMVLMLTVVAVALVVTGPVAHAIGDVIGLGSTAVGIWNVAKWPALVLIVMFTFALLYHTTPNVRPRRFRFVTWGSAIAVLLWIAASAAFALYVGNFSSYNTTYGSLGAVVVFLVWLWLSNLALLLGAVIDAELEHEATEAPAEPERSPTLRRPTSVPAERSSSRSAPFSR
jgi:membrane protein